MGSGTALRTGSRRRRQAGRSLADELVEFFDGYFDGSDDAPKSSAVDFVMQGNRHGRTAWTNEPHVAAFLTEDGVAEFGQRNDAG